MRADTQFAVVDAVLKGYGKWVSAHGKMPQQDVCMPLGFLVVLTVMQEQERRHLEDSLQTWAFNLMQRHFEVRLHPLIELSSC